MFIMTEDGFFTRSSQRVVLSGVETNVAQLESAIKYLKDMRKILGLRFDPSKLSVSHEHLFSFFESFDWNHFVFIDFPNVYQHCLNKIEDLRLSEKNPFLLTKYYLNLAFVSKDKIEKQKYYDSALLVLNNMKLQFDLKNKIQIRLLLSENLPNKDKLEDLKICLTDLESFSVQTDEMLFLKFQCLNMMVNTYEKAQNFQNMVEPLKEGFQALDKIIHKDENILVGLLKVVHNLMTSLRYIHASCSNYKEEILKYLNHGIYFIRQLQTRTNNQLSSEESYMASAFILEILFADDSLLNDNSAIYNKRQAFEEEFNKHLSFHAINREDHYYKVILLTTRIRDLIAVERDNEVHILLPAIIESLNKIKGEYQTFVDAKQVIGVYFERQNRLYEAFNLFSEIYEMGNNSRLIYTIAAMISFYAKHFKYDELINFYYDIFKRKLDNIKCGNLLIQTRDFLFYPWISLNENQHYNIGDTPVAAILLTRLLHELRILLSERHSFQLGVSLFNKIKANVENNNTHNSVSRFFKNWITISDADTKPRIIHEKVANRERLKNELDKIEEEMKERLKLSNIIRRNPETTVYLQNRIHELMDKANAIEVSRRDKLEDEPQKPIPKGQRLITEFFNSGKAEVSKNKFGAKAIGGYHQ